MTTRLIAGSIAALLVLGASRPELSRTNALLAIAADVGWVVGTGVLVYAQVFTRGGAVAAIAERLEIDVVDARARRPVDQVDQAVAHALDGGDVEFHRTDLALDPPGAAIDAAPIALGGVAHAEDDGADARAVYPREGLGEAVARGSGAVAVRGGAPPPRDGFRLGRGVAPGGRARRGGLAVCRDCVQPPTVF